MKRIYHFLFTLAILSILGTNYADARRLSSDEAKQNVRQNLNSRKSAKKFVSISTDPLTLVETITVNGAEPALYIFSRGKDKGYVIATADSGLVPVVGITDSGNYSGYNNLPESMRGMIETYKAEITDYYSNGEEDSDVTSDEPDKRKNIEPLMDFYWGQDEPFNDKCPTKGNERARVGCVGLGMALAVRYNEWPINGKGEHTCHQGGFDNAAYFDFTTANFDYSKMPDFKDFNLEDDEIEEVSKLCLAAAVATDSNFGLDATGSRARDYPFREYFNYPTEGLGLLERLYFTIKEWEDLVYEELSHKRVVVYEGNNGKEGHCFVINGYADGLFYINWGWFGDSNGYFSLSSLRPSSGGTGSNNDHNYSVAQAMVRGLHNPNTNPESASPLFTCQGFTKQEADDTFQLGSLISRSGYNYVDIGLMVTDTLGNNPMYLTSNLTNFDSSKTGAVDFNVSFNTIPDGTYRLTPVIKLGSSEAKSDSFKDWYRVYGYLKNPRYCDVTIKGGKIETSTAGSEEKFDIVFDEFTTDMPLVRGGYTGFSIKCHNNSNMPLSSVHKIAYRRGEEKPVSDKFGTELIGVGPGEVRVITMAIEGLVDSAGEYDLEIVDSENHDIKYSERIPFKMLSSNDAQLYNGVRYLAYDEENHRAMAFKINSTSAQEVVIEPKVTIKDVEYIVDEVSVSFSPYSQLKKVVFPETMKRINASSFCNSYELEDVVLPDSLEWLGGNAFGNCKSLKTINIPKKLTVINTNTFRNTQLSEIELHEGITKIGESAFFDTNLTDITLPSTLQSIENYAFSYTNLRQVKCKALTPPKITDNTFASGSYKTLIVSVPEEALEDYRKDEYWSKFLSLGNVVSDQYIIVNGLKYYINSDFDAILAGFEDGKTYDKSSLAIVDAITYNNLSYKVVGVADSAFYNVNTLTSLSGGNNLRRIGKHAFEGTKISTLAFPNNIVEIDDFAFYNCGAKTIRSLPASLKTIGEYAFAANPNLNYLTVMNPSYWFEMPITLSNIGKGAFSGCSTLTNLQFSASAELGDKVFENCSGMKAILLNNGNLSEEFVSKLKEQLQNTGFYVDAADRESYEDIFKDGTRLYTLMDAPELISGKEIKGVTDVKFKFNTNKGNPNISLFVIQAGFNPAAAANVKVDYSQFATDSIVTLKVTPLIVADNVNIALTFEQPGPSIMYSGFSITKVDTVLTISASKNEVEAGRTIQLTSKIISEDANLTNVLWNVSDESIATIDSTGLLSALKPGEVTVYGKLENKEDVCDSLIITVVEPTLGKAFIEPEDLEVAIPDVVAICKYVKNNNEKPENFNEYAADVNKDGKIDFDDAKKVVDLILQRTEPSEGKPEIEDEDEATEENVLPMRIVAYADDVFSASLDFEPIVGTSGNSASTSVSLNTSGEITALQIDIICSEGVKIKNITENLTDHTLEWSKIGDNTYRVVVYSESCETLSQHSQLFQIELEVPDPTFVYLSTTNGLVSPINPQRLELVSDGAQGEVATFIDTILSQGSDEIVDVYTISGTLVKRQATVSGLNGLLEPGIYILKGSRNTVKIIVNK